MESLKQDGIREALLDFHKKWYSSNIMKLCILSNRSLDDMEALVTELFKDVPNKEVEVPKLNEPNPIRPGDLG